MRALVKASERDRSVALTDIPKPVVGAGQVMLRMRTAAFCGTDVEIVDGLYAWRVQPRWPLVLGHEGMGDVIEVASDVKHFDEGMRVIPMSLVPCETCPACRTTSDSFCQRPDHLGMNWPGTLCEYLAVPASACIPVPDTISYADGAFVEPLAVIAHTMERIPISGSTTVAVVGAGPIALLHLLTFKALGAQDVVVVGTDGDERRLSHAKSLGATEALLDVDCTDAHRDQFDVVIEAARLGSSVDLAFVLARRGGRVGVKGISQFSKVNLLPIVRKSLTLSGEAGAFPRHYHTALQWISGKSIHPGRVATAEYSFDRAVSALEAMRSRQEIPILSIWPS
jgi:L-iditol 2-dehydrogenase